MTRFKAIALAVLPVILAAATVVPVAAASAAAQCTISGTPRADRITGTAGDDVICAGAGNDIINSLGGNDTIFAGDGSDRIDSGSGADTVSGGAGNDTIMGGSETDLLRGDAGTDSISAGSGNDLIDGGTGKDQIRTGIGDDICSGDRTDSMLDSCMVDSTSPTFSADPENQRSFSAGSTFRIRYALEDPSGVDKSWASIGGAPGWITNWCGFSVEVPRVSGDSKSATYQFECQVPVNAVNGDYTLFINGVDLLGNSLAANGFQQVPFSIIGGSSDASPPLARDLVMDSFTSRGQALTLTAAVSDETGVSGVYGWFMLDGGGFANPVTGLYANALGAATLLQGTPQAGTWTQTFQFSEQAPAGSYTLWLSLLDELGNRTFYDTSVKVTVTN